MPTKQASENRLGNLLGSPQAEADHEMLKRAFLETADYQALLYTSDFSYVVGRRGTGKSAIFQQLKEAFGSNTGLAVITEEPQDYEMIELQTLLRSVSTDYRILRPITRLLWTAYLLLKTAAIVSRHYRFSKSRHAVFLTEYIREHGTALVSGATFCTSTLKQVLSAVTRPEDIPRRIAERFAISRVTDALSESLEDAGLRVVALYDRLDEAWSPDAIPVSILGGLAKSAAEYREKRLPFYPVVFVRDNMFRALAQLDDDFTRHIEGHTLRLHWDEESLFHLVTARLRVALHIEGLESEAKVWNRFAHRDLHDREGFAKCLRQTLFRPRDILVLLNGAYVNALRDGRDCVVENDIEKSALSISQHRLEDLCKEYDRVLPGIRLFASGFRGQEATQPFRTVVERLQQIADKDDYSSTGAQDLVLFENGGEMFSALYSVGFIGLRDPASGSFLFCHDGTVSALVSIDNNRETLVHPCYWKALDISVVGEPTDLLIRVNDEYTAPPVEETRDLRLQRLGRLPEEVAQIPTGALGASDFETWVLRAVRLLFSGKLSNIELKPNPNAALSQRDVVATNATTATLWRRILEDYESRQVVFECKNYEELTPDDCRQILDYSTGEYGRFAVVVRRGNNDALSENEKDRTRSLFYEHKRLLMILPVPMITLCIRKLRTPKKYDYAEFIVSKHMDLIVRSVLSLTHHPRYKQKRKK